MAEKAEIHQIAFSEQFPEFVYAQGGTDGLPAFPPTRRAVAVMLDYLARDPGEVLGAIFPSDGEATVEKSLPTARWPTACPSICRWCWLRSRP